MSGYIAMSRAWQDHDLFAGDEFSRRDAWAWLIAQAAWRPTRVRIKGEAVELARGELCFSQRFLAEKWGWSKSRVDRFIAVLRQECMIATRSKIGATAGHPAGQGQTIITICNYDKFQTPDKGQRGAPQNEIGATAGQQRGKEEEYNQGNQKELPIGSKRRKAAKPIPSDWRPLQPGPTGAAAMIERNWPRGRREKEIEAFTAHHGSRANVMVDWQRAWQTWVLNSEKFDRNRSGSNGAGNQSTDRTLAAAEGAFGPFSTWSDNEQF